MPVRIIFMNGHCIIFVARSLHKVRKAKFNKSESECKKSLYYWLYNLRNMEQSEQEQNTVFTRLEEVARIDNLSKDERAEYEASLKAYHDNKKVMEYAAALAREEGILIGEEKGLKKGRMEGRVEGLLEAAHLMKQNGFSFEQIKLVTCLSDEEIRNL
ncbi:MAG: PD-(D/E)XK nuclease family transposase [Bacteroidales bacterium]|nr:PD-(D/E)XK nuclease family transposase [Bacteroidales bacterium]MDY6253760.1 PD-(D/E)XK nuclease family transposase [Bacteroidales bacterium]